MDNLVIDADSANKDFELNVPSVSTSLHTAFFDQSPILMVAFEKARSGQPPEVEALWYEPRASWMEATVFSVNDESGECPGVAPGN